MAKAKQMTPECAELYAAYLAARDAFEAAKIDWLRSGAFGKPMALKHGADLSSVDLASREAQQGMNRARIARNKANTAMDKASAAFHKAEKAAAKAAAKAALA